MSDDVEIVPFFGGERVTKEWVGLSDIEVYDLADEHLYSGGKNFGILSFYKAIEAKLKETNTCT